jgi:ribosomal protein S18 acetylase RimI-like enzyme
MTDSLRLRKHLLGDLAPPTWPASTNPVALSAVDPQALHRILAAAYTNGFGSVAPFEAWWTGLTADSEYDPALVFIAADEADQPIGVAQCWISGFVKDVAVMPAWRGKGIGEALLREAFHVFHGRRLAHVDLKVMRGNAPALALYRRLGMVEVPL